MERRLLLVSNFYPPSAVGGAEIVAHRHAKLLERRGWSLAVLAGRFPSQSAPTGTLDVDELEGIPVYRLSLASLDPSENFRWSRANQVLTNLIASHKPNWVHFHNVIGLGADLIRVAKQHECKTLVTLHDNWGFCFKNTRLRNNHNICSDFEECHLCTPMIHLPTLDVPIRLRRDYVSFCLAQADYLISPSADLARSYLTAGLSNVRVISNGIDLKEIPARVRSPMIPVRFLCSAYLGEHKGIPVLLEALQLLMRQDNLRGRWHLSIAGHGHLEEVVKSQIEENGLNDHVKFHGRLDRTELLSLLSTCDAVVLPSIWPENEPVTLLEAIASGAALLASDIGGNGALITHGETGLLFKPGDVEGLADAMSSLITEPKLICDFSKANIARRANFDEETSGERLSSLMVGNTCENRTVDERVIICGGGQPDVSTSLMVNLLSKALPGERVRLIWREWADERVWQKACAFWWWGNIGGLAELEMPMRYRIPIVMRAGRETINLVRVEPLLRVYESGQELLSMLLSAIASGTQTKGADDIPILRYFNQLRPRGGYYFPIGS